MNPVQRSVDLFLGLHLTWSLLKPKERGKTRDPSLPPLKSNSPLTSALQDQDRYLLPYHQCRALLLGDGIIPSGKFSLSLFNAEHEKDMVVSHIRLTCLYEALPVLSSM